MNTTQSRTVSISAGILLNALKACARVAEKRSPIPVLTMARLHGTLLTATDLDTTIHVSIGDYPESDFLIPIKGMLELLKGIDKSANVELGKTPDDNFIFAQIGEISLNLPTLPAADFPDGNLPSGMNPPLSLDAPVWSAMLDRILPAISEENSRYSISGALFRHAPDFLDVCATDGHRLHLLRYEQSTDGSGDAIIPAKALQVFRSLLGKFGNGYLSVIPSAGVTYRRAEFSHGPYTLITRLIDGQFPNYGAFIPKANHLTAHVNAEIVVAAVKRVRSCMLARGDDKTRPLVATFTLSPGMLSVSSGDCKADISVATMDSLKIGFNLDYVLDILEPIKGNVMLTAKDSDSAVMFVSDNARFVVMPVRV